VTVASTIGIMSGSGSLTVNGAMNWTGGNLNTELTIRPGATLTASGNNKALSGGFIFFQNGIMDWSGGNFLFQDFTIQNTGDINLTSNNGFLLSAPGGNMFLNDPTGVFKKSVLTGTTTFSIPVTNNGTIKGIG